jgi:hypothetical protein
MSRGDGKGAAAGALAGAAPPAVKESIFSIIRKLEKDGIGDGRRRLWLWFNDTPHVAVEQREDGYVVLLWREGVVVRITLDESLNVTGFDIETKL